MRSSPPIYSNQIETIRIYICIIGITNDSQVSVTSTTSQQPRKIVSSNSSKDKRIDRVLTWRILNGFETMRN